MAFCLGLFGGQGPNPAAALVSSGKILAFAEEERFTRIKGAPSSLPISAIYHCITSTGIGLEDIDLFAFGWDCPRYVREMPDFFSALEQSHSYNDNKFNKIHEQILRLGFNPDRIETELRFAFAKRGSVIKDLKISYYRHHLCHAASAYFCSGFEQANVLTLDGSGEEYSCVLWAAEGQDIKEVKSFKLPNTLGGYYATFTEFLGFKPDEEEGKLMGLAPYGSYSDEIQKKLDLFLQFSMRDGTYSLNPKLRFFGDRSYGKRFTDEFVSIFGEPRTFNSPLSEYHKNLAFNVQWRLEQVAISLVRDLHRTTGFKNLCLSGGVAMNCKMNGQIAAMQEVERIFVQPASGDSGVALGAALLASRDSGTTRFSAMNHAYFGSAYSDSNYMAALTEAKIHFFSSTKVFEDVATLLMRGYIVAWFQGAAEVGARALGNRSILASPIGVGVRDKLNREVKHRESWRPFCPSVTEESYHRYFPECKYSDYMIMAFPLTESLREEVPAVVHVDGSARPQRVTKEANSRFHALLVEFGRLSGHEMLVNTSFNVMGEPIVNSPHDAIRCFGGTGIDVLCLGDFIALKPNVVLEG